MVDISPYGGQQLQTGIIASQPQQVVGTQPLQKGNLVSQPQQVLGTQQLQNGYVTGQPQEVVGTQQLQNGNIVSQPQQVVGTQQLQNGNIAGQPQQVAAVYTPSPGGQLLVTPKYTDSGQNPVYATAPGFGGPGAPLFNMNPASGGFVQQQQTPMRGYGQGITLTMPTEQQTPYFQQRLPMQRSWSAETFRGGGCCTIS